MDTEHLKSQLQSDNLEAFFEQITTQPKRQFTQEEINKARGNLALMNDRVFLVTFADNKINHIVTEIVSSLRRIHGLTPIPPIERTTVQSISLLDVLGRGMVGDLLGEGESINISIEVQRKSQDDYAVRGILSSSNIMRHQFDVGDDFSEAPDVIGINILGFKLPQLKNRTMFCSRIVRAEYESKEAFLADKYSDYYIELPKMDDWTKEKLPKEYHDLWDLCHIFKAKIKEHEEVIRMQAISNPIALELSQEVRKTVAPGDFVNDTLNRKSELEQLRDYVLRREQKREATGMEKMIVMALQSNATTNVIETMQKGAGITDARLAELRKQAQMV
jgi:hypothetical protein